MNLGAQRLIHLGGLEQCSEGPLWVVGGRSNAVLGARLGTMGGQRIDTRSPDREADDNQAGPPTRRLIAKTDQTIASHGCIDHCLRRSGQRSEHSQRQVSMTQGIAFEVHAVCSIYGSAGVSTKLVVASSVASAASWSASTSAIRRLLMIPPKLVNTGHADRDHIRCICQQLILIGRTIGNYHVTIE
jgi:hypothetical protein